MRLLFIPQSSIQNKLLISYFLLLVFIVGIISIAVYKISEAIIVNQVGRSRLEVLEQIGRNINIISHSAGPGPDSWVRFITLLNRIGSSSKSCHFHKC